MPDIVPTQLTEGSSESNLSSYSTASISPTADNLVLAFVNQVTATAASGSNTPTCSGAGMTWVQVATQSYDSENPDRGRVTMFRALDASPGSGALTFDFGGETQARASWGIIEFSGVDTGGADGADAIVQTVQDEKLPGASDADTPFLTLATFEDLANATFGVIGVGFPDVSVTVGEGFVEQNNVAVGSNGSRTQSQFRPTNHVGVDWTLSALGTESGFFAVELRNATPHDLIDINVLTSGFTESDSTSYATASVQPAADRVVLAICSGRDTPTRPIPTVSGCGITWVQVASFAVVLSGGENRISIFRGINAGPTLGAITFSFGGASQFRNSHAIIELVGADTGGADGADAIVQTATDGTSAGTSVSATLAAFGDIKHATLGVCSLDNPSISGPASPGTGFSFILNLLTGSQFNSIGLEFRTDPDTSVDFSSALSGQLAIIGLEIKNAVAGAPILKVAADTLDLAIINEAGEDVAALAVADTLGLDLAEVAALQASALSQGDLVTLGDFAEFGPAAGFKELEIDTPDAIVLGDSPETAFATGPVSVAKTLIIAEIKLTQETLFRAGKGIRHPTRMYVGKVQSFGSIIRSIQVPSGLAQIGDAELTIIDTDGELRRLMSETPPQNREVVVKIGGEGESESIFQIAYTGIIVHATFPPGLAKIRLSDNTFKFLNEQLPDLLTRENFTPDPVFARNIRQRTEGRFDETEIFSPIVFGIMDSSGLDVIGSMNAVRLDSTTFNLAQHPIPHGPIRIFIKDPDARPNPDQSFIEQIGGFSIVEVAKTIDGVDYIFTHVVFGTGQADGFEVRWDGEGMTDTGDQFGTAIRDPAEAIKQYLIRIAGRDPGTELDLIGFDDAGETMAATDTGAPAPGFFCDGAITQRMTHREALARMTRSFGIFLFTNKDGRITIRYIGESDPDRPTIDDVQDIYVKSETHQLARPIVNEVNLQYLRMNSEQSWQGLLTVSDEDAIADLERVESKDLKLFFVRDDFVADRVARDFLQFTNPGSFRIVMTVPGHRRTADVELAQLFGVTNYSGLDPSGLGYENKEFLVQKTEFRTDSKELRVHAVARAEPPAFGLREATSLETFRVRASDGLFVPGLWLELTGRPPRASGFANPVVLPFSSRWITVQISQGFGGFPGVVVPTIGLLDFGVGPPGSVVPILEGIAILIDATGVDALAVRMYSFPWQGFREGDRLWARARDNLLVRDVISIPQTHDWDGDITIWR